MQAYFAQLSPDHALQWFILREDRVNHFGTTMRFTGKRVFWAILLSVLLGGLFYGRYQ